MNEQLPGLVVDLEARIDKFERAFARANRTQRNASRDMDRRAQQSARSMSTAYDRAGRSIEGTFSRLSRLRIPFAVVTAGAAASVAAIDRVVRSIAELGAQADRAGLGAEEFQEWAFVAEQNRIGIDALVDAFKEMNLRVDEFIVTGAGPAAEALQRLGFDAEELARAIQDPTALMDDLIRRMRDLDTAARIRVADEIFGGTGGEQFVRLIDQGAGSLRELRRQARESGAVLDAELIDRAEEIDRRFREITATVRTFFQRVVVEAVDAGAEIAGVRAELEEMFRSMEQARSILGADAFDALADDARATADSEDAIRRLRQVYEQFGDSVRMLVPELQRAGQLASSYGYAELASNLNTASQEMTDLVRGLQDGSVSTDEFETNMAELSSETATALAALGDVDRADFSTVIAGVEALVGRLAAAAATAADLRANLTGGGGTGPVGSGRGADPRDFGGSFAGWNTRNGTVNAPSTSIRPGTRPNDIDFGYYPDNATGGGGGGGGGDSYRQMADQIKEQVRLLDLERAAFVAAAAAGGQLAGAIDAARMKAGLLNTALASGGADTPALRAEIDALAATYGRAASEMAVAEERLRGIEDARNQVASIGENAFVGLVTGALTLQQALRQVLSELVKIAASRLFRMLFSGGLGGGGGLLGGLFGGILGFSQGGFTGPGGRLEPAGIVHRGEFVMSKPAVDRLGVGALENLHSGALRGYSEGGLVGGATRFAAPQAGARAAGSAITINAPVTVNASGGSAEQNADLARRVSTEMEKTMRQVVVTELQRQMRPGNLLAGR